MVITTQQTEEKPAIAIMILAAGASTRMGRRPKQLLLYQGRTLVQLAPIQLRFRLFRRQFLTSNSGFPKNLLRNIK